MFHKQRNTYPGNEEEYKNGWSGIYCNEQRVPEAQGGMILSVINSQVLVLRLAIIIILILPNSISLQ